MTGTDKGGTSRFMLLQISKKIEPYVAIIPALLVLTDLLARYHEDFASLAAYFWIAVMIGIWIIPLVLLVIIRGSFIGFSLTFLFVGTSLIFGWQDRFVNFETTQQMSCFLSEFASTHLGFLSNCFLGYPTRTYFLAGVPSLVFGKSIPALNIGQHLITYSGIAAFVLGVGRLQRGIAGEVIVFFSLLFAFSAYHVPFLLLSYEQSSFPFSIALQFTGFFLLYLKTSRIEFLSFATSAAIFSAYSYTPALSLVAIASALLLLLLIERRTIWHLVYALSISTTAITAFLTRQDHSISASGLTVSKTLNATGQINSILSFSWNNPLASPVVITALLLMMVLALFNSFFVGSKDSAALLLKYWVVVFCALVSWTFATILASIGLHGYASPPPELALHRASLIFPVVSGILIYMAFCRNPPNKTISLLMCTTAAMLFWRLGVRFSNENALKAFAPAPFRVMELAQEATNYHFFEVATPPHIYFEWPGDGIVNGYDYNQYFGMVAEYKGLDDCASIPPEMLPALIVKSRQSSKCKAPVNRCVGLFFLNSSDLELCQISKPFTTNKK